MTAKGRSPIDYFRFFYNDAAVGGAGSAIRCGSIFSAPRTVRHRLPVRSRSGPMFIRDTIAAIDGVVSTRRRAATLYCGNALSMLKMTVE